MLDQSDKTPFDFQIYGSAPFDRLEQGAAGLDGEGLTASERHKVSHKSPKQGRNEEDSKA